MPAASARFDLVLCSRSAVKSNKSFNTKNWLNEKIGTFKKNFDYQKICVMLADEIDITKIESGFKDFANDLLRVMDQSVPHKKEVETRSKEKSLKKLGVTK